MFCAVFISAQSPILGLILSVAFLVALICVFLLGLSPEKSDTAVMLQASNMTDEVNEETIAVISAAVSTLLKDKDFELKSVQGINK